METGNVEEYGYVKCSYPGCDSMCWTYPDGDDYNMCSGCEQLYCQEHGINHSTLSGSLYCNLCYDEMSEEERKEMSFDDDDVESDSMSDAGSDSVRDAGSGDMKVD